MAKTKRSVIASSKVGKIAQNEIETVVKAVHVIPDDEGQWAVKKSGASRVRKRFDSQLEAVKFAREISRDQDSSLIIHGPGGSVQRIAKKPSPKGKTVHVTFELPAEAAESSVAIAGSFNEWDVNTHPMKLNKKKGVWTKSISFKPGETVEFRYFLDDQEWKSDEEADGFAPSPFFSENSVLAL